MSGLIWGAAIAYLIDRKVRLAAAFAFAGAGLTLLGVIHGPTLGFYPNSIALGYALMGLTILLFSGAEITPEGPEL